MPLTADPGLVLTFYSPAPASLSADALALLASWSATSVAIEVKGAAKPA